MTWALLVKDTKIYFRNQLFAVMTGLVMAAFLAVYLFMPATEEDTLGFALYAGGGEKLPITESLSEGLEATVYYAPGTPGELREAYNDVLTLGVNHFRLGEESPVDLVEESEVLGPDLLGKPLAMRDRLLPMLIVVIFTVEMFGLATIIVEEIEQGTATAVLTTPLRTGQFLASKAIMGVGLAFVQVLVLIVVTGHMMDSPLIVITSLLLGSLFVGGISFLLAAVAHDMMSVISWGILAFAHRGRMSRRISLFYWQWALEHSCWGPRS